MHVPVMLAESLEYLAIRPEGIYVDATAGLGGHTRAIAERLTTGFVIANDRDPESLATARQNTAELADRVRFHHGRFSELRMALAAMGIEKVDGLLADLGVSRYQLTEPERGFSLLAEGPLDMRMYRSQGEPVSGIVKVDGLLADLGVSRYQLTEPERGFSLLAEGPLDMRMYRSQGEPVSGIV